MQDIVNARNRILLESQSSTAPQVTHVDALPDGTRLGEFEIQGLLGVGGFGMVYRAYDHSLHRTVAIKEYMPAALAGRHNGATVSVRSSTDEGSYKSGLQSFVAEARLLAKFDHPSLVKVYRFWEANNTAYMVMPLYTGMTLKQARSLMKAPPPEEWLCTVLWSILQALHVLHRSETLHRDVSPDNIFLQDVGPPVLLDLGASRRAIQDTSRQMTAVLKVNYAPIEQYAEDESLKQGPWTDLYSLAAVVYTMLCNDPPPPATSRVLRDGMPAVRSVAATVKGHFGLKYSDRFVRTIGHALSVQPADRPQSVAAFVTEMKLRPPPRLSKFDWRAELGTELASGTGGNATRSGDAQARTLELPVTVVNQTGKKESGARIDLRRIFRIGGLTAAGVALLVGGVLVFDWMTKDSPLIAAPEQAVTPVPVVPRLEERPEPGATEVAGGEPAPSTEALAPTAPAGAAVVAPAATVASEGAPPAMAPKPEPKPPVEKAEPKPVPKKTAPKPEPKPVPRPVAKPAPPPAPAPRIITTPRPAATAAPRELCPDANFFTKPMCIHLECQKAENAQLPACIENRKRYPGGTGPG